MMGYTSSQNLPSILEQMFGLRLKEDKSKIQASSAPASPSSSLFSSLSFGFAQPRSRSFTFAQP